MEQRLSCISSRCSIAFTPRPGLLYSSLHMISVYSVLYRSCVSKRYQLVTGCLFVCMYLEKQPRVSKTADCSSRVAK